MKSLLLLFGVLLISTSAIDEVRSQFPEIDSKEQAESFIELLKDNKSPEAKGYSAAMILMKSRYVIFPLTKLKYFKEGKKELNDVIKKNPKNVEIRYLRFSMQKQIPNFLGYHDNLNEDFNLIINDIEISTIHHSLKDKILSNMLLLNNLTSNEKSKLTKLMNRL